MQREIDVRQKLKAAIDGSLSVRELDAWLSDVVWNAHRDAELSARELIDLAHFRVYDYYNSNDSARGNRLSHDLASLLNNIHESWVIADDVRVIATEPAKPFVLRMPVGVFSS